MCSRNQIISREKRKTVGVRQWYKDLPAWNKAVLLYSFQYGANTVEAEACLLHDIKLYEEVAFVMRSSGFLILAHKTHSLLSGDLRRHYDQKLPAPADTWFIYLAVGDLAAALRATDKRLPYIAWDRRHEGKFYPRIFLFDKVEALIYGIKP